ncbi:conjugal transfer protein [Streptomyces sp. NPDC001904]|uniref:conjugal transfer protein n=1 Tax=Streptomyces sp. NPDC001904 TaxID=3154531 RepID=UPI00331712DE
MPAPETQGPPTAAGVALERTRRSVRLGRAGVWMCLLAGPVALTMTLAQPGATVVAQAVPSPARPVAAAPATADPAGYAVEFVEAWLRSNDDEPDSQAARRALQLAPDVSLPNASDEAKAPRTVTSVRSVRLGSGRWSVTVAVQYADAVRYLSVPVTASESGTAVSVTGVPAVVAGPSPAKPSRSPYTVDVADGVLTDTVADFLGAYLAGGAPIDRYLAPKTSLTAVSPAVASSVDVDTVSAKEDRADEEQVPADGTRVHVRAAATARTAQGAWPLSYELTLAARGGRWEIAGLAEDESEAK